MTRSFIWLLIPAVLLVAGVAIRRIQLRLHEALTAQKLPPRRPFSMTGARAGDRELQRSQEDRRARWDATAAPFRRQQTMVAIVAAAILVVVARFALG